MLPLTYVLSSFKCSNLSHLNITWRQIWNIRVSLLLFKNRKAVVLTLRELLLRNYSCHAHSGMLYPIVCPLSRNCPWLIIALYVGHSSMCASQALHLRTVRDPVPQTSFSKYENMRRRTNSRHSLCLLSRRKDTVGEKKGRLVRTQQIITVALYH
jgi:hypothetical protein